MGLNNNNRPNQEERRSGNLSVRSVKLCATLSFTEVPGVHTELHRDPHVALQKKLLIQEHFDPQHIQRQQAYHNNVAPPEGEATVDTSLAVAQ